MHTCKHAYTYTCSFIHITFDINIYRLMHTHTLLFPTYLQTYMHEHAYIEHLALYKIIVLDVFYQDMPNSLR